MKIDITSMFFNSKIEGQTATPAWGTSIGQNKSKGCRIDDFKQEIVDMVIGMTYKSISDRENLDVSKGSSDRDIITCSVFNDVYINNQRIDNAQYVLLLVREHSKSHEGRLLISYAPYIKYGGVTNQDCINKMQRILGCNDDGCWFVYDISIKNQAELYFSAVVVNPTSPMIYSPSTSSRERSKEWKSMIPGDYEDFDTQPLLSETLQQIFYGAPGTGKSHEVKKQTGELLDSGEEIDLPNVFRTTFHPDTDYASFVGCYKPAMESKEPIYTPAQLIDKLSIIKNSGASYPCQKFGAKYWESLKELSANDIKQILTACGFTDSMSVEVPKGIAIGEEFASLNSNKQIVYRFVPQTFTDAYIYAYTHSTEQTYLVIEEINRGNCAQIFGDLFQLLDRKGGVSEYKIKADKDLAQYLRDKLEADSEGIKDGKLCLPANLHILATMNTSDQSLFPMDSAFKRRWEWEYVPINYNDTIKSGTFDITIGEKPNEKSYSWVGFIEKVNEKIFELTQSEDKQMGNFFIKQSIDEKGFKSKVMFYLWYEVLRDETENNKYFFYKKTIVDGKEVSSKFTFKDLFGDKATETLQQFMEYLEVAPK